MRDVQSSECEPHGSIVLVDISSSRFLVIRREETEKDSFIFDDDYADEVWPRGVRRTEPSAAFLPRRALFGAPATQLSSAAFSPVVEKSFT